MLITRLFLGSLIVLISWLGAFTWQSDLRQETKTLFSVFEIIFYLPAWFLFAITFLTIKDGKIRRNSLLWRLLAAWHGKKEMPELVRICPVYYILVASVIILIGLGLTLATCFVEILIGLGLVSVDLIDHILSSLKIFWFNAAIDLTHIFTFIPPPPQPVQQIEIPLFMEITASIIAIIFLTAFCIMLWHYWTKIKQAIDEFSALTKQLLYAAYHRACLPLMVEK